MPDIQPNDWREYKERVFFQLDQLTAEQKELNSKYSLMREDIIKIKKDIESHPILCPLNPEEIKKIVIDEQSKLPAQSLDRQSKYATIIAVLFSAVAIIVALIRKF